MASIGDDRSQHAGSHTDPAECLGSQEHVAKDSPIWLLNGQREKVSPCQLCFGYKKL